MSPSLCGQLKTELNAIRALADSFDAAFERAKETGGMTGLFPEALMIPLRYGTDEE